MTADYQPMTNKERADRAYALIAGYCGESGDPHADVAYFLADLMHWAQTYGSAHQEISTNAIARLSQGIGVLPFADLVAWAYEHYDEEQPARV